MKKAIFISIDAMIALLVVILLISTLSVLTKKYDNNDLVLYRTARDYYEVKRVNFSATLPNGFEQGTNCDSKSDVVIEKAFEYNKTTNSLQGVIVKVCYS